MSPWFAEDSDSQGRPQKDLGIYGFAQMIQ